MKRGILELARGIWPPNASINVSRWQHVARNRYAGFKTARRLVGLREQPSLRRAFSTSSEGPQNIKVRITTKTDDARGSFSAGVSQSVVDSESETAWSQGKEEEAQKEKHDSTGKQDPITVIPVGIAGCASLILAGYLLSYLRAKDENDVGVLAMIERGMENAVEWLSSLLPAEEGPLLPDVKELNYPPNLPTLVVDLDKVIAKMEYDRRYGWQVKKRPHADRFFRELVNYYELVLWSDDSYPVATDVANRWGLPVIGCIHRDQCKKFKGSYLKDLSKLGRDLRRVILLDHDRVACMMQEDNAILVREFDGDENDKELLYLIGLLKTIALNPNDVTVQLKQMGGGLDLDLGRRFAEKNMHNSERAKSRQNLSKLFGFKHY